MKCNEINNMRYISIAKRKHIPSLGKQLIGAAVIISFFFSTLWIHRELKLLSHLLSSRWQTWKRNFQIVIRCPFKPKTDHIAPPSFPIPDCKARRGLGLIDRTVHVIETRLNMVWTRWPAVYRWISRSISFRTGRCD